MDRAFILAFGLCFLSASVAFAQDLPEGTFATTEDGCKALAGKTPAELGEDLDFQVLSKKGLVAYQQVCDFVGVAGHDSTSWVATAFCDEGGYTYPDLFSIKKKDENTLNVTRVTDLTENSDDSSGQDSNAADQPESSGEGTSDEGGAAKDKGAPAPDEQQAESYSTFVKCQSVKQ
jgi:hypothetical protein